MNAPSSRWDRIYHSILFRVLLFSFIGVVITNGVRAYFSFTLLKTDTMEAVTAQQRIRAQDVANDIAQMVARRQATLQELSRALPTALLGQPEALSEWLHGQQRLLKSDFDGLSVERVDGAVIAKFPPSSDSFSAAGGDDITDVQIGLIHQAPTLSMAVALPRPEGHDTLRLRAIRRLATPGFFDPGKTHQNGERGNYTVVFPHQRLFFDLGEPVPRLETMAAEENHALFQLGSEDRSTEEPVLKLHGQEVLAATSPVPGTNWSVIAYLPIEEALVSVEQRTQYYRNAVPFILPIFLLAYGLFVYYILRPLGRTARQAEKMTRGETPLTRLPVGRPDEIGALTSAFNRLLDRLNDQSKELSTQKELAEAAAMAKSRFLAAASHDLRQPMHALNLYLGSLDHVDLPDEARSVLSSARKCAQTMDEMFRALLDISKLDANALQANIEVFAIAPLLEKIRNSFVLQALAKGIELRVAPCSAYVASDPEILERVLFNLVSNAVRYTKHGKILLGCRRTTSGLRIAVYDTGLGIAANQQRAVFEEFYQIGNPGRDRAQGLGLGLAIVQRLAALLKAPLTLTSTLGRGSVFSIEVCRAQHELPAAMDTPHAERRSHGRLDGALVAVIDDEPLILDATALVLRRWGCLVVTATSGQEAVAQLSLSDRVPDVIVCDHRLQGTETGIDVIAAIRSEFNSDIPAVLITGDTSPQRIQSILTTGIPVLNKPLQDHVLMDALLRLLNQLPMA